MPVDVLYPVRQQKPSGFLSLIQYFFASRRQHTSYIGDWSSDVCSSDLAMAEGMGRHRLECSAALYLRGGARLRRLAADHPVRRNDVRGRAFTVRVGRAEEKVFTQNF